MIIIGVGFLFSFSTRLANSNLQGTDSSKIAFIDSLLEVSSQRYQVLIQSLGSEKTFPLSVDANYDLIRVKSTHWTSGFFPGSLWYLYEFSDDQYFKEAATNWTERLYREKDNNKTHDVGFMMHCSYGNAYRLTGMEEYGTILMESSESLVNRFDSTTGCIRSWDWGKWQYPVIIDNMMNLELLYFASGYSGNPYYKQVAISHADKTLENHFRDDYSCWHVVDYNPHDGTAIARGTHQGFSDNSTWTRGIAWAVYGYIISYKATKKQVYLKQALQVLDFLLSHKKLPRDLIPYWDMDCPDIPNTYRDVSSAAILASALVDLHLITNEAYYLDVCLKLIRTLGSKKYMAQSEKNPGFILEHSVGNLPQGTEIDVPIIYADYYFIEALIKLKRIYD